jgi:hypothetical protein
MHKAKLYLAPPRRVICKKLFYVRRPKIQARVIHRPLTRYPWVQRHIELCKHSVSHYVYLS